MEGKGIPTAAIVGGIVLVILLVVVAYIALSPRKTAYAQYTPPPEQKPAGIGGLAQLIPLFL